MRLLSEAIDNPAIERLDLDLDEGRIIWVRNRPKEICECDWCDECADRCDCRDDDELEKFKQDTEDDDST